MLPQLEWVRELQGSLSRILGTGITLSVGDDVDPLKKIATLELGEDLIKGDYQPVQKMVHLFAKMNNCVVLKIRRAPRKIILEVLLKRRIAPESKVNPLK